LASGRPALILALVAVLLLAPSLLLGTMLSHSSPHNLTWAEQFSEQFRDFILYPRWMPDSFEGLGGPAFYFYPPLAFWVDALLSVVTFNALSLSYRLSLTWLVILWASGLAMHAWLRQEIGDGRIALWGAIAYMAAPYHLLDHYLRGAFAEFTVYVFLPLVLLSIRRPVLLAFSYAGLVASHLPVALLVSVTVLPAYLLFRLRKPVEWLRAAAGGLLGLGLAAIYLLPALTLQAWISADQFWTRFYHIENWYLLAFDRWPEPPVMYIVTSFAVAWAILALGICLFFRKRGDAFFWAAVALACVVLMTGLFPWFWQLPEVAKVQFPWRLLVVVEFAVITALCHVRPTLQRGPVYLFTLALFAAVPGLSLAVLDIRDRVNDTLGKAPVIASDVMEYEPRGFPNDLGIAQIKNVPEISCTPVPRLCRAESGRFGTMRIEVDSEAVTDVALRRFFFPAWRLDSGLPLAPTEPLQLVSFKAPAGRTSVALLRVVLPVEHWAWAISGLSLALILALFVQSIWATAAWRGIRQP
jgi:hypothetical protein